MRAVVISEFGVLPTVREVPAPTCPDDGVVLRVTATGVCRSDWHGWQGHDDDITLPHVPGHELAGVVVEVGPLVRCVGGRRRGHRAVRVRVRDLRRVPRGRAAGVRAAAPAGVHRRRVVRRARRDPPRRRQPGPAPGRHVPGHRGGPGLPVRDRLPGRHRPRPGRGGGLGRGARLRRRGAVGGHGRRRRRCPGRRGRRVARRPRRSAARWVPPSSWTAPATSPRRSTR